MAIDENIDSRVDFRKNRGERNLMCDQRGLPVLFGSNGFNSSIEFGLRRVGITRERNKGLAKNQRNLTWMVKQILIRLYVLTPTTTLAYYEMIIVSGRSMIFGRQLRKNYALKLNVCL